MRNENSKIKIFDGNAWEKAKEVREQLAKKERESNDLGDGLLCSCVDCIDDEIPLDFIKDKETIDFSDNHTTIRNISRINIQNNRGGQQHS